MCVFLYFHHLPVCLFFLALYMPVCDSLLFLLCVYPKFVSPKCVCACTYLYVCVCVCRCVRERERESWKETAVSLYVRPAIWRGKEVKEEEEVEKEEEEDEEHCSAWGAMTAITFRHITQTTQKDMTHTHTWIAVWRLFREPLGCLWCAKILEWNLLQRPTHHGCTDIFRLKSAGVFIYDCFQSSVSIL